MILIKSFLTKVLCHRFRLIDAYFNKGDTVPKCYSCLKVITQAHLRVGFFKILFIKRASFKRFYLYMKLLQSTTIFKQKIIIKVSCD